MQQSRQDTILGRRAPHWTQLQAASAVLLVTILPVVAAGCSSSPEPGGPTGPATMTGGVMASGGVGHTGGELGTGGQGGPDTGGHSSTGGAMSTGGHMIVPGACSVARATPGCDDQAVMDCVCAQAGGAECCSKAWDIICVELVRSFECTGDCCHATGALGCADTATEGAVCGMYAPCCTDGWDDFCTVIAESETGCGAP